MSADIIFEPLKWRNIEIKNRIFRSSISGRWDNEDGSLTQVRVNWESRFAKGGVGAIRGQGSMRRSGLGGRLRAFPRLTKIISTTWTMGWCSAQRKSWAAT